MGSKTTDNLSLVIRKKGELVLTQVDKPPAPGPNEVLLRMRRVGICGSDVHLVQHGAMGEYVLTHPIIIGHEGCGQVVEVGSSVTHLKAGDVVAIEPQTPCRDCIQCRSGKYNLCPTVGTHGVPPHNGSLTRYIKHDASFCFKLPDGMTPEEGALIEPLSVGVFACQRAPVTLEQSVLVCGSGPIGLVTLMAAKAFGASHVCVIDMNEQRLETAKTIGADSVILTKPGEDPQEVAKRAIAAIGRAPDVTIDCVGVQSTIVTGIYATKVGGILANVGCGSLKVEIPLQTANSKEIDFKGIFRYRHTWPLGIQLVSEKRVDVKKLVTHRFKLEQAHEAFEVAKSGACIKVMIDLD